MKSRRYKILLDTSFLLPTLGVDVEKEVYEVMGVLRKFETYYLEVGLIEAFWVVIRKVDRKDMDVVEEGLKAIRKTYKLLKTPIEAYIKAVKIYDLGHRDFIDAIHYTTALHTGIKWLTIDKTFVNFLNEHDLRKDVVLLPENLNPKS